MSDIRIDAIDKSFGDTAVLREVSLHIASGEFVAILGPSGCGKTTLLRCLAGFETLDGGRIEIGGELVSAPRHHVPPERRNIGVVFQNYALWPHMSVAQNVAYGLKVAGLAKKQRAERVARVLEVVELGALADRRPADLSGGQRQRVALARCLAMESRAVLLDEPLANLDVHLRGALEEEFAAFHKRSGATMFYITHDQSEALALADRVAVMDKGRILQFDRPEALFARPANETVAGFIGEGRVLEAEDIRPLGNGRAAASLLGQKVELRCAPGEGPRSRASISIHPGDLHLVSDDATANADAGGIAANVTRATYRGAYLRADVMAGPQGSVPLSINIPAPASVSQGQRVTLSLRDGWVIPQTVHSAAASSLPSSACL
ncbi:iron(III) transport system ATP-binding protein [Breoghania corrubedonensis]|uniref:Iron(III) transport system ATP-binding protein n=1 Tax=Breoghania corrubedonensis TaxID=665038 RepID=A0A2T5VI86_9HYPH|nr:ABC transporter ATP-binding protein [Breoghania corrubedonensis]PTW63428.1 iron(III) transport system ATP-binding protein [Breoghania corrubedonensis]